MNGKRVLSRVVDCGHWKRAILGVALKDLHFGVKVFQESFHCGRCIGVRILGFGFSGAILCGAGVA